jgi:aspartate kinase
MSLVVQKYGGTSLSDEVGREAAVSKILKCKREGNHVVVVVSAIGRRGEPYATDSLISLVEEGRAIPKREMDLLMSCGEIISAVVLASYVYKRTQNVTVLTGYQAGIITDDNFGEANILEIKTEKIWELLKEDRIVIVAGFQGATIYGDVTTLGRGGSDITAAAIGVALGAEKVEVYTDVDGVATCDPKLTPQAPVLTWLDYKTALELSSQGAKVLHPKAVQILYGQGIPLIVKNIVGDHPGTRIVPGESMTKSSKPM